MRSPAAGSRVVLVEVIEKTTSRAVSGSAIVKDKTGRRAKVQVRPVEACQWQARIGVKLPSNSSRKHGVVDQAEKGIGLAEHRPARMQGVGLPAQPRRSTAGPAAGGALPPQPSRARRDNRKRLRARMVFVGPTTAHP